MAPIASVMTVDARMLANGGRWRFRARAGRGHAMSRPGQVIGDQRDDIRFVVDAEDSVSHTLAFRSDE